MIHKIFKALILTALALIAIPFGIVFTVIETVLFTAQNLFRNIWSLVRGFFYSLSKIVSVASGKFLTRLLTIQGVPFGTHSISAVLGANLRERSLSKTGEWVVMMLDSIEENHCSRAAEKAGI